MIIEFLIQKYVKKTWIRENSFLVQLDLKGGVADDITTDPRNYKYYYH